MRPGGRRCPTSWSAARAVLPRGRAPSRALERVAGPKARWCARARGFAGRLVHLGRSAGSRPHGGIRSRSGREIRLGRSASLGSRLHGSGLLLRHGRCRGRRWSVVCCRSIRCCGRRARRRASVLRIVVRRRRPTCSVHWGGVPLPLSEAGCPTGAWAGQSLTTATIRQRDRCRLFDWCRRRGSRRRSGRAHLNDPRLLSGSGLPDDRRHLAGRCCAPTKRCDSAEMTPETFTGF